VHVRDECDRQLLELKCAVSYGSERVGCPDPLDALRAGDDSRSWSRRMDETRDVVRRQVVWCSAWEMDRLRTQAQCDASASSWA
jgi:hypothetical protein